VSAQYPEEQTPGGGLFKLTSQNQKSSGTFCCFGNQRGASETTAFSSRRALRYSAIAPPRCTTRQ